MVSNFSPTALTVEIAWYPQDLTQRLATQFQALPSGGNVVLDTSQVQNVNGNAGLAVVTPVMSAADARPVVPPLRNDDRPTASSGALAGGFTLADFSTNSAFGQNPLARVAVDAAGQRAAAGALVDGTAIRYQQIQPAALVVPFYFNPGGGTALTNRAILALFQDLYTANRFDIGPRSLTLTAAFLDAAGNAVGQGSLPVSGVAFTDVQSLAGPTPLTSSGKIRFTSDTPLTGANANLLGLMSQSLGTFAVGQGLPGYFAKQDRFVDNGDGTITDRQTHLQWEKKEANVFGALHDVDNKYTWSAAGGGTLPNGTLFTEFLGMLNNCTSSDGKTDANAGFAGHCDWRLPTIGELQTLLLGPFECANPCIDPIFDPTAVNSNLYWSASTTVRDSTDVWGINFKNGLVIDLLAKSGGFNVRAVRRDSSSDR